MKARGFQRERRSKGAGAVFGKSRRLSAETEPSGLCDDVVRVERRGKSSPAAWRHAGAVNSIRSNTVERDMKAGPAVPMEVA